MDRFCIQAHCQSKLNQEATGESLCAVPGSDCLSGAQAFRDGLPCFVLNTDGGCYLSAFQFSASYRLYQ